jgi:hypothetical protein
VISVAPSNVAIRPNAALLDLERPLLHFANKSAMTGDYIMWDCVILFTLWVQIPITKFNL